MNPTKSASKSQKTTNDPRATAGKDNPFQQILVLEQAEQERVQKEKNGMEEEENQAQQACEKREATAEQEQKEKAKKELKKYKEDDLAPMLEVAEGDAAERVKQLEQQYEKNADALAQKLAGKLMEDDSPILA